MEYGWLAIKTFPPLRINFSRILQSVFVNLSLPKIISGMSESSSNEISTLEFFSEGSDVWITENPSASRY